MSRTYSMDRRAYLKATGVAGATLALAGCFGADEDTIIPGTASGFPPFEYVEEGELVGFDVDLSEAVIEEAGYDVGEWTDIEFDSLLPSLKEGDIDLIAAAMTINAERQEEIAFTDPYWEADQAVLVAEDGIDPGSFDDLEGLSVGAQAGTTGEDMVQSQLIDTGIISESDYRAYDNYTLAISDLEGGSIDAVVIDSPVADTFAEGRSVRVAFIEETGEQFGFGMRQNDDRVGDLNDALSTLREEGTYDDLVGEWFE